jgi:hypothetical protein
MGQRSIIIDDVVSIDVRMEEDDYAKKTLPNLLENTTILKTSIHRLGSPPLQTLAMQAGE